jgi:5-methyltetrahydropteroyltriglutamate--homocysteine methyltransferase
MGSESFAQELEMSKSGLAAAGVDHTQVFYPQLGVGWLSHFTFNEFYKNDEEFAFALAEGMKDPYKAVIDAGFILQIDDPSLVSRFAMLDPRPSFDSYRKLEQMWTAAVNHAISGLPEERIRYHICWGSFHHPHTHDVPFQEIVDLFLSVNAGAYSVEGASVNHELDYQVWENTKLPDGKILIPGVISHATSNEVEPPELVAHRLVTYARLVGRENVIAGTDCGPGGRCQDDVAWAKLESLVRGAELASEVLWG